MTLDLRVSFPYVRWRQKAKSLLVLYFLFRNLESCMALFMI